MVIRSAGLSLAKPICKKLSPFAPIKAIHTGSLICGLPRISVKYPVFTIMMMFCLMVLGLASWQRMGVEEFPDVDFPFVVIYTNYPGASPETVESEITKKLEDQINTISGLKQVISQSSEGLSIITTEFNLDVTSTTAAQDVRDKIASVTAEFRDEIQEPIVERYDPTANAVMSIVFESDNMDVKALSSYLDQRIVPQLRTVPGSERSICWVMHSARSGFRWNRKNYKPLASVWTV